MAQSYRFGPGWWLARRVVRDMADATRRWAASTRKQDMGNRTALRAQAAGRTGLSERIRVRNGE